MNTTTRRFPRTLLEAFPHDASYANPIQRYRKPLTKRLFSARFTFCCCAMAAVFAVLLMSGCTDDLVAANAEGANLRDAQQAAVVAMRGE